ncbi:hypothetical protein HO133_008152 [Letharia lupina]|uniref:Cytochrome P450 n=1 Tax=Letharia lupina TaxID=560253 RepID=A0A8H6CRW1_9LECA|nr:uncharacterized protein HO133_008152 [Letharia lupina]KAF6228422.1 hypothetical protein HO133_008152 [Letharia lupina]
MFSTIVLALLVSFALYALKIYTQFARNLTAAKTSGIPYVIIPFYQVNRLYQLSQIFLVPIVRKLPASWTELWFDLTLEWAWARRYEPFKRLGTDTFITVSPERNELYTADAAVISQITGRKNDFPKALEVYESIKLYGNNVITSEGQLWRHHRKITSPPFSEKNNHLVWTETLEQCQAMVNDWFDGNTGKTESKTIYTLADDAMRLSLYVISRAGFGVHLQWPGTEGAHANGGVKNGEERKVSSPVTAQGHSMSYTDALGSLLHNILWVLILPPFLLKHLPFQKTKETHTAFIEWGKYMDEMFQQKKAAVLKGMEGDSMDLMTALVKGAGITKESLTGEKPLAQTLTDREILGNAFVFIVAAHETTANSIHFCLVLLAMNIAAQRHLQADLDEIFQGHPVSEAEYEKIIPKLFASMAGAVLNEELRLIAPVVGIPKSTLKESPQPLEIGGKTCTVPADCYISLITPAVHRNPNQWPTGPPANPDKPTHPLSNLDNDLEEFKPERWILDPDAKNTASMPEQEADTEASDLGVNTAADTSAALYRPPKGAYIPFSEGHRSCIGRRFAQVEILAVLALIFSQYSVELAVDAYVSDDEVDRMTDQAKFEVWSKARDEATRQMNEDMGAIITLQLRKGAIGIRFVKRGKERFDFNAI